MLDRCRLGIGMQKVENAGVQKCSRRDRFVGVSRRQARSRVTKELVRQGLLSEASNGRQTPNQHQPDHKIMIPPRTSS